MIIISIISWFSVVLPFLTPYLTFISFLLFFNFPWHLILLTFFFDLYFDRSSRVFNLTHTFELMCRYFSLRVIFEKRETVKTLTPNVYLFGEWIICVSFYFILLCCLVSSLVWSCLALRFILMWCGMMCCRSHITVTNETIWFLIWSLFSVP